MTTMLTRTTRMGSTAADDGLAPPLYVRCLESLCEFYAERGLAADDLTLAEVEFAVALARHQLAPRAGRMLQQRLHVMVFGGAGAGKSTVANILMGCRLAEVNAQAGFTRHPIAYYQVEKHEPGLLWPRTLGKLIRGDEAAPADLDENRFSCRALEAAGPAKEFFSRHVVWDCPDLTTKDASHYEARVIEIAGLADVCVYVASDERYNDELPTNFLQAMLEAGKPVVVVLTKVHSADVDELVHLFQTQVSARLKHRERIVAIVAVPSPPPGRTEELWTDAFPYGEALRKAIESLPGDLVAIQQGSRRSAIEYLKQHQNRLLEPLRNDLGEWRGWIELVRRGANDAVLRYEREYLVSVHEPDFERALHEVLRALELPGALRPVSQALRWLRQPYRFLRTLVVRLAPTARGEPVAEDEALDRIRRGLIESLQVACANRRTRHSLWASLHICLRDQGETRFERAYQAARVGHSQEIREKLVGMVESVKAAVTARPWVQRSLIIFRLLADLVAIVAAWWWLGWRWATLAAAILALGLLDEIVRGLCGRFVERHRAEIIRRQKEHVRELIRVVYIDGLLRLPDEQGPRLAALLTLEERLTSELQGLSLPPATAGTGDPAP